MDLVNGLHACGGRSRSTHERPERMNHTAIVRWALAAPLLLIAFGCGEFQREADAKFGDQHFKTAIALIELHKVRFGEYPSALSDLKFTGDWDTLALQSVKYERLSTGYSLDLVRGWVGKPELTYPDEFWRSLGLVRSNQRKSGGA